MNGESLSDLARRTGENISTFTAENISTFTARVRRDRERLHTYFAAS